MNTCFPFSRRGDSVLQEMEAQAAKRDIPIVGPVVGRVLFQYARLINAKKVFELDQLVLRRIALIRVKGTGCSAPFCLCLLIKGWNGCSSAIDAAGLPSGQLSWRGAPERSKPAWQQRRAGLPP
jgi:hypothetical protein